MMHVCGTKGDELKQKQNNSITWGSIHYKDAVLPVRLFQISKMRQL